MTGPIPFAAFMQRALHDPQRGYYARHIPTVGGRGDFTTAPMLSDHLARAIASWAAGALKQSGIRHLIEVGPGTGDLAAKVWKALPFLLRRKTKLHLVETSAPLTQHQQKQLGCIATWHTTIEDALKACNGEAIIYSNELVDAFPVRLFEKSTTAWLEVAVSIDPDGIATEHLMPAAELPPSSIFQRDFPTGQRVEIHDSYRHWLTNWMPDWQAGRLLTIDYGAEAPHLYHRQPGGSLRAYLLHQRLTGPAIYQNIGRQDLTADINFTDLIDWSAAWTSDHRLTTFADFLGPNAPTQLTDPDGAGTAFLVLEQGILP